MNNHPRRRHLARTIAAITAISAGLATTTVIAAEDGANEIEEVMVIGSRRAARSSTDTPAPVDVISGAEFTRNAASDVQELLRTAVPSYNVNAQPISDAATISRPANLRGLSPDNTLVLVNGKRRHRGSVISFLGGGIADGAQGVDIATFPSLALKRVEVLRDGASSQYGSDAIAGVINFVLRDDAEGGFLEVTSGSTYEGDGDNYRVAGNIGLPLGDNGFINITGEYGETDGTVRSIVRDDVRALIAAGNTAAGDFQTINTFTGEVPQYWGAPDVEDDLKIFVNAGIEINENAEIYAFGNIAEREVTGGFFYRNPTNRPGVYKGPALDPVTLLPTPLDADGDPIITNSIGSVRVGDLDGLGVGGACPSFIPLTGNANLIPDATILAQVTADANCFSFVETIPGGFVPRFGGTNEDQSFAIGVRGTLDNDLTYDLSVYNGSNETNFVIRNTVNASLGPNTPRDFVPGGQKQSETVYNADFSFPVQTGFASDLSIAFGAEYREEDFDLYAGDAASFALGPLADQGFSSSSNGFGGFPNSTSSSQDSYAVYGELEADVTDALTLQVAMRFEDYSDFGDTTDYKIAGIYRVSESFKIRSAISTGFHAPTAGQANITNVTTQNVNGVLVDQGTLPLSSSAGQLAANFIASQGNGRPTLGPEDAQNFSLGVAFDVGESEWTVDFYNIEVEDRVALGANIDFLDALNFAGGGSTFTSVSAALTGLDASGVINRQEFIGLDDLSQFRFFANSFDTRTRGIDVVGRTGFDAWDGYSNLTVALNYNTTKVTDRGVINPISAGRQQSLEDLLPRVKGNVSWTHTQGQLRGLVRLNYYGEWDDTGNGVNGIGAEILVDVEASYTLDNGLELIGGVANLFDTYNDENPFAGGLGQLYPESGPFGLNGGQWYLKAKYSFE
jgi:iron complex outermembrane receptor protein